jgi:nucleotide-binding universal stress UspA family protein
MYRNILVAIDLWEPSSWQKALPVATELCRAFGAQIHVTTVVRDFDAIWRSQYSLATFESMISEAETRLTSVIAESIPKDLKVNRTVGHGSIYAEVLRTARESGADLIVMASHRPEMKGYLIGANADRVVRHASCSVLVVRDS